MYLVTSARMRELDRRATEAGIPALALMENAGRALAAEAASYLRETGVHPRGGEPPVALVLAGPGQNGGDGFCAARHLSSMGYGVEVLFFGDESRLPAEARTNLEALKACPVPVRHFTTQTGSREAGSVGPSHISGNVGVTVDALLGTGQKGDPRPPIDAAVRLANDLHEKGVPVVACDVPTGVDADTGGLFSPAISADVTVTMGFPKVGLYSYPGRARSGRIVVETLGFPPLIGEAPSHAKAVFIEAAREAMPSRQADHHKGLSGHVTVLAGSVGMAGAAVLCAKAALRAGAGTVTLLCPEGIYAACAAMTPEVMVLPCILGSHFFRDQEAIRVAAGFISRSSCLVIGPGLGRDGGQEDFLSDLLPLIRDARVPCLIDADGLYALARLGGLSYLSGYEGKFMLTPHPGELAYLTGTGVAKTGMDRPGYAVRAALASKSVVCLKGAGTCVANSVGDLRVNTSGDPVLATAGSGDVLAGVIAALVSQGLSSFDASWLGVYWHGYAGEIARRGHGSYGALAGDLCDCLPPARHEIEGR